MSENNEIGSYLYQIVVTGVNGELEIAYSSEDLEMATRKYKLILEALSIGWNVVLNDGSTRIEAARLQTVKEIEV